MRNDFETGYLEHSAAGTTWKKKAAKYLSRVWKNGRWVYEYKITGKGYLRDAKSFQKRINRSGIAANKARSENNESKYKAADKMASYYVEKKIIAENDYSKSLAGKIERGQEVIRDILDSLKPQTTVRITSNLMPANTEKVYKKKK